jgi:hypothetical protein
MDQQIIKKYKDKILYFITNKKLVFSIIILITIGASLQKYFQQHGNPGVYLIYKHAYLNLINLKDLYTLNPHLDIDYFLYPPPFIFLFLPCALLPNILGCVLWNLIGVGLILWAVKMLPIKENLKTLFIGIILFDMISSMQNFQSNILIAALILLTFVAFEKNKILYAALCCALGFFSKIFGLGFAILFLFHKRKFKFLVILTVLLIIIFLLPLLLIGFDTTYFAFVYKKWIYSLSLNTTSNINFTGVLKSWFNINLLESSIPVLSPVQLVALFIGALPLLKIKNYKILEFRLLYTASLLIWVVIFNPKAESPSYIIAMTGVALWFTSQNFKPWKLALLIFAILFTALSSTDLFPKVIRQNFCTPYGIKAVPCIVIWFAVIIQLLFQKFIPEKQKN